MPRLFIEAEIGFSVESIAESIDGVNILYRVDLRVPDVHNLPDARSLMAGASCSRLQPQSGFCPTGCIWSPG
ncbi:hypothetical protein [Thiocapsa rosea]|uniref:hypothetical protein n=1 Tax=Thiocapsa rosea TaxID=69360 RepID=UPI000EB42DF0|nr:hypothetical protein [Thiocapsa rosea]